MSAPITRKDASGALQVLDPTRYAAKNPERARYVAWCGACLRQWDDGISNGVTPAPGGRCPFEYRHRT